MTRYVFLWNNADLTSLRYLVLALVLSIILIGVTPAFAGLFIPEWFYNVYQYWKNGEITEREFSDSISYMEKIDAMKLQKDSDPIASFVLTDSIIKQDASETGFSDCTSGWYITGYFTPSESDYTGKFVDLTIDGMQYKFREDFVTEIKTEGWGRTISGNYLGWYDDSFHLYDYPLDAMGNELKVYSIAIDPQLIPSGSRIMIPSLPTPWNEAVFTGTDTGTAIIGKHIDVYTGEGKSALDEAYRITGHDNVVCIEAR